MFIRINFLYLWFLLHLLNAYSQRLGKILCLQICVASSFNMRHGLTLAHANFVLFSLHSICVYVSYINLIKIVISVALVRRVR